MAVLPQLSLLSCPVPAILSLLSCGHPVFSFLSWLIIPSVLFGCPIPAVLSWLSCSASALLSPPLLLPLYCHAVLYCPPCPLCPCVVHSKTCSNLPLTVWTSNSWQWLALLKNQPSALLKINFWGVEKSKTSLSIPGLFQPFILELRQNFDGQI